LPPTSYFFERGARFVRRFFLSAALFERCTFRAVLVSCDERNKNFDGATIAIIDVERSRPHAKKIIPCMVCVDRHGRHRTANSVSAFLTAREF